MKLCMELYDRISNLAKTYNNKYEDITFDVKHSNTTNSIYLIVSSDGNGLFIKKKHRFSDHKNSEVKTKIIAKSTKFAYINRLFDSIVIDLQITRSKVLIDQLKKSNSN